VLVNNPMPRTQLDVYDRSVLTLATSRDGRVFDQAWCLRGGPTASRYDGRYKTNGYQYPHALSWNGALHVAYSVNKEDVQVAQLAPGWPKSYATFRPLIGSSVRTLGHSRPTRATL
jgi:hypothetical protein